MLSALKNLIVRPPSAPVDDLETQLKDATEAHAATVATTADAVAAFDQDGSETSAKALSKARESEALTGEHLARARRLLENARAREVAAARKALEEERATLQAELARRNEEENPLIDAEVAAIEALIDARAARYDFERQCSRKQTRVDIIARDLGEDPPSRYPTPPVPSPVRVAKRIDELLQQQEIDQTRRDLLRGAMPERSSYIPDPPRLWTGEQPIANPGLGSDKPVPQRVFEAQSPNRIG